VRIDSSITYRTIVCSSRFVRLRKLAGMSCRIRRPLRRWRIIASRTLYSLAAAWVLRSSLSSRASRAKRSLASFEALLMTCCRSIYVE
jgi:hypothetical protein